jgi:hypothetical protein
MKSDVLHQVLDQTARREITGEPLAYTPTADTLPRRFADFDTLGEALDYAARGVRGLNFHNPRGQLVRAYPYAELRDDALAAAYRLISHGVRPGDRVALTAETGPEFAALFFGAVYAGAWPVPLPLPTSFGGRESYIDRNSGGGRHCLGTFRRARRTGSAAPRSQPRRHCLSAIFERLDPLPARRCRHP